TIVASGLLLVDRNPNHLDRLFRSVTGIRVRAFDLTDHVEPIDDLAEYRVLRGTRGKPVQICVMHGVNEELTAAAVGPAGVGHGQRAGLVGELGVSRMLVLDTPIGPVARTCARAECI